MSIRIDEFMYPADAAEVARLAHHVGLRQSSEVGGALREVVVVWGIAPGLVQIGGSQRTYALPAEGEDLAFALALADGARRPGGGKVVTVTGASGGLGASTFAATLAAVAQEAGESVALVEGDRASGALQAMLSLPYPARLCWEDLVGPGPVVADRLVPLLPKWRGVSVVAGDPGAGATPEAVIAVVTALRRSFSLVVVDVPRDFWFADQALNLVADLRVALVAPTPESKARAVSLADQYLGSRERERWILRRASRSSEHFWHVSMMLGIWDGQLFTLAQERGLAAAVAAGEGPWGRRNGPLRRAATCILRELKNLGEEELSSEWDSFGLVDYSDE